MTKLTLVKYVPYLSFRAEQDRKLLYPLSSKEVCELVEVATEVTVTAFHLSFGLLVSCEAFNALLPQLPRFHSVKEMTLQRVPTFPHFSFSQSHVQDTHFSTVGLFISLIASLSLAAPLSRVRISCIPLGGENGLKPLIRSLSRHHGIEVFELSYCSIESAEDLLLLSSWTRNQPNLTSLSLSGNVHINLPSLNLLLLSCTHLVSLDLSSLQSGDELLHELQSSLSGLRQLQNFKLDNTSFGLKGAQILDQILLSSWSSLRSIILSPSPSAFEAVIPGLMNQKNLTRLSLPHLKIGEDCALHLARLLESNASFTHLDLSNAFLNDDAIESLKQGLRHQQALVDLALLGDHLHSEGFEPIVTSLQGVSSLTRIELVSIDIRELMPEFVSALSRQSRLHEISLIGCQIGIKEAILLNRALLTLDLCVLNLSCNRLDVESLQALQSGIAKQSRLNRLDLAEANFNRQGAEALNVILNSISSLSTLNLLHTSITDDMLLAFLPGLEHQDNLTSMFLLGNNLNANSLSLLGNRLILSNLRSIRSILCALHWETNEFLQIAMARNSGLSMHGSNLGSDLRQRASGNLLLDM